jgi:hypothetical protein
MVVGAGTSNLHAVQETHMNDETQPMPTKLGETNLVLKSKDLIEVDPGDGENFYAYDLVPDTEEYSGKYTYPHQPVEVYVAVNRQSTAEFNELKVGSKFKLVPTK